MSELRRNWNDLRNLVTNTKNSIEDTKQYYALADHVRNHVDWIIHLLAQLHCFLFINSLFLVRFIVTLQIDAKYREFSAFLQTIHSQIPFVKSETEITELINRIDTYITNNEARQLQELTNLAAVSKRVYGYDKTIELCI